MAEFVSIGIYTFVIAYTSVGNLRQWAARRLLALPNERSSHTMPTPSGGGVAIVLTSLLGLVLFAFLTEKPLPGEWRLVLIGALLVAVISWLDDLYTMSVFTRMSVHLASALVILLGVGGMHLVTLPFIGPIPLGWLGGLVTVMWIGGLINAYNFMDGIDGLAASQAVIAGVAWALVGQQVGDQLVLILGLVLAASSLAFLGYNWPPARIFMGDVGSAFLGYSFAVLTVLATRQQPQAALLGLLVIWPFLFDTLFTIIRRWRRGEPVLQAHRSHLYQRLVIAGYSHRTVTLLYTGLSLVGFLLSIGWMTRWPHIDLLIVVCVPLLAIGLVSAVTYIEAKQHYGTPLIQSASTGETTRA
ncbi:MAG: glycosyltransferase family 4 protein [Caldilineaceae bacterium]|nr:glycosyltransferase family 4 protein [Caldilineaceae bacterium]